MSSSPFPLCEADPATFWPWLTWTDFAQLSAKESFLVVVPIVGMAEWGLDAPLAAEEAVLMPVLAEASRQCSPAVRLLVVPPLRFVAGPATTCAFAVDAPTALTFVEEVCRSIQAAGFRKIVLLNSSPWNEELVDAAARDVRIDHGLQMFCVNLSALGLDFHAGRSPNRLGLKRILSAERDPTVASEAASAIASAGRHLSSLLAEIAARSPLPRDGQLITMSAP